MPEQRDLVKWRQILVSRFGLGELRTLCFDLGVEYDILPGEGKAGKARELLALLERRGRLDDLFELASRQRPDIDWRSETKAASVFFNRERELALLKVERLRAARSPYTLISAPAGYGKSYLLAYLIHTLEADPALARQWCIRYVDCDVQAGEQIAWIVEAIAESSLDDAGEPASVWLCDHIIGELGVRLAQGRRAVLLIFDTVERLSPEGCTWLYGLLHKLHGRTRAGGRETITVRVLLVGWEVEEFWEGYAQAWPRPPAPQRVTLNPFDQDPIQDMLRHYARIEQVPLQEHIVVQLAAQIEHLSGGHPQIVHALVEDLAGQAFGIGDDVAAYFVSRRERLVKAFVSPVAAALLASLPAHTQEAACVLGIFRRINANTLQALVQAGELSPETNEVDLLGALHLEAPSIREPFYRDRLMRRVLALDMLYGSAEDRTRYQRLNVTALKLYAGWICEGLQDPHLGATQRLLAIVEWLFHALQDDTIVEQTLCDKLWGHKQVLGGGRIVVDLVVGEIQRDVELIYLLQQRLGAGGVELVCSWLTDS